MWRDFNGPPQVSSAPSSSAPAGLSPSYQISGAGAPTDGVTGLNVAPQGTEYINTANGQKYTNTGSAAAPVWHIILQG